MVIEEFGRGDVLGMMEMLQKRPRNSTVLAVRFSQLARVPEGLLNFVKMQFPQVNFTGFLNSKHFLAFSRSAFDSFDFWDSFTKIDAPAILACKTQRLFKRVRTSR